MTFVGQDKPSLEDALQHYGVKGMKWGVRRQARLDQLNRVASGKGSKLDKAKVGLTEVKIKRHETLADAAGRKAKNMEARKTRIQNGEATVRDLLNHIGGDRVVDIGRSSVTRADHKARKAEKKTQKAQKKANEDRLMKKIGALEDKKNRTPAETRELFRLDRELRGK